MKRWYNNSIAEKLICDNEPIPDGYVIGRLPKPKAIDILKEKVSKKDLFNFYIIQNNDYPTTVNHFNINRAALRRLLDAYQIKKDPKMARKNNKYIRPRSVIEEVARKSSETQKRMWREKPLEEKKAWSDKQKASHSTQEFRDKHNASMKIYFENRSDELKDAQNAKRSATLKRTHAERGAEIIAQRNATARKNRALKEKSICRTLIEQFIYDDLIKEYPSLIYDIKVDSRYPYYCDFYIKDLDLFIEINAHPSHGKFPYNPNDNKCIEESYRFYGAWLKIYVNTDPEKYQIASQNNLNYLRIYPYITLEENYKLNNYKFIEIINLIFESIHKYKNPITD